MRQRGLHVHYYTSLPVPFGAADLLLLVCSICDGSEREAERTNGIKEKRSVKEVLHFFKL